jgi:hypothetical protein
MEKPGATSDLPHLPVCAPVIRGRKTGVLDRAHIFVQ